MSQVLYIMSKIKLYSRNNAANCTAYLLTEVQLLTFLFLLLGGVVDDEVGGRLLAAERQSRHLQGAEG